MKRKTKFLLGLIASAGIGIAAGQSLCRLIDIYVENTYGFEAVINSPQAGAIEAVRQMTKIPPYEVMPNAVTPVKAPEEDVAGLDFTDEESQMLLKLAMAEAEDQGVTGKALVMNVVKNRLDSDEFPNTIEEVIFQPYQFTPVLDGRYDAAVPDEECYEALEMVLNYWDASNGALYFEADWNESPWHKDNLTMLFAYENMTFYK